MLVGVLAGLTTGALWGLTFIAPLAVRPFSAWDLTVVRYGIFGLASVLLMVSPRFRPGRTTRRQIATGLLLGGFGYTSYVCFIFFAVHFAGVAIPPLIIGTTPVVVAIATKKAADGVSWRALAVPLALIMAGVVSVNLSTLAVTPPGGQADVMLGAACAVGSLCVWVAYAAINTGVMQAPNAPEALRWTGIQGVGAALGSLCLLPLTSFRGLGQSLGLLSGPDGTRFLLWCLAMGLGGSWLATLCWVTASRRLPLALAGQLIVGETVFGLLYGFIFEARWPAPGEAVGAVLQIGGIVTAVAIFQARRTAPRGPDRLCEGPAISGSADREALDARQLQA